MQDDDGTKKPSPDEGMTKYAVSPTTLTKEAQGVAEGDHEPLCQNGLVELTAAPCPYCGAVKSG